MRSLIVLSLLAPNITQACSLAEGYWPAHFPENQSVLGPMPVFVAAHGEPTLIDDASNAVTLVEVSDHPFVGAQTAYYGPAVVYQPAVPLAPGSYTFFGDEGETEVTVVDDKPAPGAPSAVSLSMSITHYEEDSQGCVSHAVAGCSDGDTTILNVQIGDDNASADYLVTVMTASAEQAFLVAATDYNTGSLSFRSYDLSSSLAKEEHCVLVSRVGEDGALSAGIDAGCIDARDAGDPRITRYGNDSQGCAAASSGGVLALLVLLAQMMWRRRNA